MTVRFIEIHTCDRCEDEYNPHSASLTTIGDLRYMVMRNGGGSMKSNMSLELCDECTIAFLAFMGHVGNS